MPLNVGRAKSKSLLDEVMPGDKLIGVCTQKSADESKISVLSATLENAQRDQARLKDAAGRKVRQLVCRFLPVSTALSGTSASIHRLVCQVRSIRKALVSKAFTSFPEPIP